jgi:hypothetical protein
MKMPRLATALYTVLIAFVLILITLRFTHQLSGQSFWWLYGLGIVFGILVRQLPKPQAKKA